MVAGRVVLAVALCVLVVAPARACGSGAVLFADHFQHAEPNWQGEGEHVSVAHGVLEVEPPQNANWYAYYAGMPYRRLDVCVTLSIADFHAAGDMGAGVLFWVGDREHNDVFMIRPDGNWILAAHEGDTWQPAASGSSPAIRQGKGVVNEVEVRLDEGRGEALVNGTVVTSFTGTPPARRFALGFYAESEVDQQDAWTFHSMEVRRLLPGAMAAPSPGAPPGPG